MARRDNDLFIGKEFLNAQGRTIKHIGLVKKFANLNIGKLSDTPIKGYGLDIETNHLTGEMKLLGIWNGKNYQYYTDDFLMWLFSLIKRCDHESKSMFYWNKLDPFVIFKQFLLVVSKEAQQKALERYGKIGGKWSRKDKDWELPPVIELEIGDYRFGIKNVIRSSIQFFKYKIGSQFCNTVWAYDIAQLYKSGLEKEMTSRKELFPYYSKLDQSAHLVDWERFNSDKHYKYDIVLKSNEYDARAVHDLALHIQDLFFNAFGYYTNTLVSTGSLARASLVAVIRNKYKDDTRTDEEIDDLVTEDVKSISIKNYLDEWFYQLGHYDHKDFLSLTTEAYSGGLIETFMYGFTESAFYSDIASAYPSVIQYLYDLRGSIITTGLGEPPRTEHSYVFIRGTVNIPVDVEFHPLTVKSPVFEDTNIRAVGEYIASYTLEERDFLIEQGATFYDEKWYHIQTKGELSPIAHAVIEFVNLRTKYLSEGNSAEYVAKISANSMYGILFECVDTYEEIDDEIEKSGYRAGEFFNPIYATIITARTRILISRTNTAIKKKGGKPILTMTDATFWQGSKDMIPEEFIKEVKTLGFFEEPQEVKNLVCLGSGRYSYYDPIKDYISTKKRGLNITDIHDPSGVVLDAQDWGNALEIVKRTNETKIKVGVRKLVSVGMVKHSKVWTVNDLGRVVTDITEVDVITGLTKRILSDKTVLSNPSILANGLIGTESIHLSFGMLGDSQLVDQSLPIIRNEMLKKHHKPSKVKDRRNRVVASEKYTRKHKNKINKRNKTIYNGLKDFGYSSYDRQKMCKWSKLKLLDKLRQDDKIKGELPMWVYKIK